MDRRQFLKLTSGAAAAFKLLPNAARMPTEELVERVCNATASAIPVDANTDVSDIQVLRDWRGGICTTRIVNRGKRPVRIREVVVAELQHGLLPSTPIYGESFQMLSQTIGTIAQPANLGYDELQHYKLPQPDGVAVLSGLVMFAPSRAGTVAVAFTSCRRFIGRFYLNAAKLQAVLDTEGLELAPSEEWDGEELMVLAGPHEPSIKTEIARRITRNHPHPLRRPVPTGWCSWYCFGPRVTAKEVLDNLNAIRTNVPGLRYIQIDDGYQRAMGDWLETGQGFGGDVRSVLDEIRKHGFQPAIWVAPFIAEHDSHLFQQHPDWFMKDADGQPLPANKVTFQGWRRGPWYALDGTHPEVQKHLEMLFHTVRQEWGCTYFKLDANFWGAMHGARLHDVRATRIQAYRCGMQAIRRGAGDAFILGCNHPIWPSFGLIDGSRSSGDIKRTWENFKKQARQTLSRNWQNGALWWNDPDAILLTGQLSDDEFQFHATAAYAGGGMILSGDDLTGIPPKRLTMLRKLLPPTGVAAKFEDSSLRVGVVQLASARAYCVFNSEDQAQTVSFALPRRTSVRDFWTEQDLGSHARSFTLKDMPPHSARLLICG